MPTASVIQRDCNELAVALFPSSGFSSLSFARNAAEQSERDGLRILASHAGGLNYE